jgi:hypothetical protein
MEALTLAEIVAATGRTRNAVQSQFKRSSIRISGYILGKKSRQVGVYEKSDVQHLLPSDIVFINRKVIPLSGEKAIKKCKLDLVLCQSVIKRGLL